MSYIPLYIFIIFYFSIGIGTAIKFSDKITVPLFLFLLFLLPLLTIMVTIIIITFVFCNVFLFYKTRNPMKKIVFMFKCFAECICFMPMIAGFIGIEDYNLPTYYDGESKKTVENDVNKSFKETVGNCYQIIYRDMSSRLNFSPRGNYPSHWPL